MSRRYSIFTLARNAVGHHKGWARAWRGPEPKRSYAAIVIGGAGDGLATAYYLAKEHGISDVAVLEKAIEAAATCRASKNGSPKRRPSSAGRPIEKGGAVAKVGE